MSLNWDARDTAAYRNLLEIQEREDPDATYSQHQSNVLDTLIWATLMVDLPGLPTEEDADEFYFRLQFLKEIGAYDPQVPDIPNMRLGLSDDEVEKRGEKFFAIETDEQVFRHPKNSDREGWYERRDRSLTRDDLDEWVGLTTNVSRKTRHQFCARHAKIAREEVERRIAREREEVTA